MTQPAEAVTLQTIPFLDLKADYLELKDELVGHGVAIGNANGSFPIAEKMARGVLSLLMWPQLKTKAMQHFVWDIITINPRDYHDF